MKKISLFFVTAILMIAFAACTGATKTDAPAEQPVKTDSAVQAKPAAQPDSVAQAATAAPATPALSPEETLKNFQAYAKSYGEAFNNLTKDPGKFTELSKQYQQKISEVEQIKSQLTPKQQQDYQKALDIIIKVNKGGK